MLNDNEYFAYVGNWRTGSASWGQPPLSGYGFGIFRFEAQSGELTNPLSAFDDISVGAMAIDATRRILYCTNETMTPPGKVAGGGGQVCAFSIDPMSGSLTELCRVPSYGSLPSYLTLDSSGRYLLVTNHTGRWPVTKIRSSGSGDFHIDVQYDDATTILFPIAPDGSIGKPCDVHVHDGTAGPLAKQTHSQPHSVVRAPNDDLFVVCDKGCDEIRMLRLDCEARKLELCGGRGMPLSPGSSPRYSVFHPTLRYFYVNHETAPMISVLSYDVSGSARLVGTVDLLSPGYDNEASASASDLVLHPSGKYLYCLIRGIDAISAFDVNQSDGSLRPIQTLTLDASGPRGCTFTPDGRFLLIAALKSNEVAIWSVEADGTLAPTGKRVGQAFPGNVALMPIG
ncbi:beta-propeller fold lactonase family protein [Caballeronia sp. ATUFL_M1_KS5A]|uniref:lactonase family protein n=1 Tax=Caballeronia sp. ATUFL_M1_KS5A TaxID=2921778 RepID=UPI0020294669|nr:beta-propeller fold lactonase family protein [Caballeronia sp. ATUFL_M1_KS5A]